MFWFKNNNINLLWLPAYLGKSANAATVQLIASPGAHNFVVERLIELADLLGRESDSNDQLAELRYDPSEPLEFEAWLLARVAVYTARTVLIESAVLATEARGAAVGRLASRVAFHFRLGTLFFAAGSPRTGFATTRIISNSAR